MPGSVGGWANQINDSGQIVGRYDAGGRIHGYLLSEGSYTTIDVPGSTLTTAVGIDNSGQIVGRYDAGGRAHGYLLSEGSYTTVDPPGSTFNLAHAINDSGQIVSFYIDSQGRTHGYLATPVEEDDAPLVPGVSNAEDTMNDGGPGSLSSPIVVDVTRKTSGSEQPWSDATGLSVPSPGVSKATDQVFADLSRDRFSDGWVNELALGH